MSIEIYDNAAIVKKADTYYLLLKRGSKNSFMSAGQSRIEKDFRRRFHPKMVRDSEWKCIAYGDGRNMFNSGIAATFWNAPTSEIYGVVRFGNKKNIALYFSKLYTQGRAQLYENLDEVQRENIDTILSWDTEYRINLNDIPQEKAMKNQIQYCGETYALGANCLRYKGAAYWNLNNL